MAVLPSEDSETESPCGAAPVAPCRDQLASLLGPDATAARVDPRRPAEADVVAIPHVVGLPANDGRVAVGGQRDRAALSGVSRRSRTDQLVSLLGPQTPPLRV